jgi:hypothetical protein
MLKGSRTSLAIAATLAVLTIGAAFSVDETNRSGLTHAGATLGFNGKIDRKGRSPMSRTTAPASGCSVTTCRPTGNLRNTPKGYQRT